MASGLPSLGPRPWTVDEFLAWEREQAERYEFVDGVVRMMDGGPLAHTAECVQDDRIPRQATDKQCSPTPVGSARLALPSSSSATLKHTLIKGNLFYALHTKLTKPWHAFVSGPKVVTATASLYPDVLVTCSPVVMTDDTVREPKLIAEVLSRTTAHHDRSTKWLAYREIASLAHYLLVWQDVRRVELFSRRGSGWELVILDPPAMIEISALGASLDFDELYDGVQDA